MAKNVGIDFYKETILNHVTHFDEIKNYKDSDTELGLGGFGVVSLWNRITTSEDEGNEKDDTKRPQKIAVKTFQPGEEKAFFNESKAIVNIMNRIDNCEYILKILIYR